MLQFIKLLTSNLSKSSFQSTGPEK